MNCYLVKAKHHCEQTEAEQMEKMRKEYPGFEFLEKIMGDKFV